MLLSSQLIGLPPTLLYQGFNGVFVVLITDGCVNKRGLGNNEINRNEKPPNHRLDSRHT